jgi:2-iminobutanoate/2-iminopropanoate deaminase
VHNVIHTQDAPAPIGPYSHAVVWERLVFLSGQGPVDPSTGNVEARDFGGQVRQTLANVDAVLHAAGTSRDRVLKVQLYLVDLGNFDTVNAMYDEFFAHCQKPARTTIQAAALPGGIQFEMDVTAYRAAPGA